MECGIRKWKSEDSANLAASLNNMNVQKNLRDGLPYPYTESDALQFINDAQSNDNNIYFAITLDEKAIGSIGIDRKNNIHRYTGELGYYIAEPYWGKGIGTVAVREICKYVFKNTDIIRIFAEPFSYNFASCRVLEKNSFIHEGTLRSNARKDGETLDMEMYSLIKNQQL